MIFSKIQLKKAKEDFSKQAKCKCTRVEQVGGKTLMPFFETELDALKFANVFYKYKAVYSQNLKEWYARIRDAFYDKETY